jgi:hypothetical protein
MSFWKHEPARGGRGGRGKGHRRGAGVRWPRRRRACSGQRAEAAGLAARGGGQGQRTAKADRGVEELEADARVCADGVAHLLHVGASGLAQRADGVDGADALGQERVGGQLGQLGGPEVGGEDALDRHPVLVHRLEHLDGPLARGGLRAADEHLQGGAGSDCWLRPLLAAGLPGEARRGVAAAAAAGRGAGRGAPCRGSAGPSWRCPPPGTRGWTGSQTPRSRRGSCA